MQFPVFAYAAVLAVTFASTTKNNDVSSSSEESSSVEDNAVYVPVANATNSAKPEVAAQVPASKVAPALDEKVAFQMSSDGEHQPRKNSAKVRVMNVSLVDIRVKEKRPKIERKKEEKDVDSSSDTNPGSSDEEKATPRRPKSRLSSKTTVSAKGQSDGKSSHGRRTAVNSKRTASTTRQNQANSRFDEKRLKLIKRMKRFIDKNSDHPLNKLLARMMSIISMADEPSIDVAWKDLGTERCNAVRNAFSNFLRALGTLNKFVCAKNSNGKEATIHYAPESGESLDLLQDCRFDRVANGCLALSRKDFGKMDFIFFANMLMDLFEQDELFDAVEVDIFSPMLELLKDWEVASCGFPFKAKRTKELSEFYRILTHDLQKDLKTVVSLLTKDNYGKAGFLQINRFREEKKLPEPQATVANIPQAKTTQLTRILQTTGLTRVNISERDCYAVALTVFLMLLIMQFFKTAAVEVPRIFC